MFGTHWVSKCVNCNAEFALECIVNEIKQDIKKFNALSRSKNLGKLFMVEEGRGGRLLIYRAHDAFRESSKTPELAPILDFRNDAVSLDIQTNKRRIVVHRGKDVFLEIDVRWNRENAQCQLLIEGFETSLEDVCYNILYDFFFTGST